MGFGELLALILMLILLILIIFGVINPLRFGLSSITSCKDKQGECGNPGESNRDVMGTGYFSDCKEAQVCYWKTEWEGGKGNALNGGVDVTTGLNVRMALFKGDFSASDSQSVFTGKMGNENDIVKVDSITKGQTYTLYTGSKYAFYALIYGKDETYSWCKLYLKEGDAYTQGTDNILPLGKTATILNSPCKTADETEKWSQPLYYVPTNSEAGKEIRLVVRRTKNQNGAGADAEPSGEMFMAKFKVIASPKLQYSTFQGPLTDVASLESNDWRDKEVSFVLDNEWGTITFKNVRITAKDEMSFNFDQLIAFDQGMVDVQGKLLTYIPSGKLVQVTLKKTGFKGALATPILTVWDWSNSGERIERPTCDSGICSSTEFRQSNDEFSFMANIVGKDLLFRLYPGTCKGSGRDACLVNSIDVGSLNCNWKQESCAACIANPGCNAYSDEVFCDRNPCKVQEKCMWAKRKLIGLFDFGLPDRCESCIEKLACKDYKTSNACDVNPCGFPGSCAWYIPKSQCLDCGLIMTCADYDLVRKNKDFCAANLCGINGGCLQVSGECQATPIDIDSSVGDGTGDGSTA